MYLELSLLFLQQCFHSQFTKNLSFWLNKSYLKLAMKLNFTTGRWVKYIWLTQTAILQYYFFSCILGQPHLKHLYWFQQCIFKMDIFQKKPALLKDAQQLVTSHSNKTCQSATTVWFCFFFPLHSLTGLNFKTTLCLSKLGHLLRPSISNCQFLNVVNIVLIITE